MALSLNRAIKALYERKQAWRDESQPSTPTNGADLRSTSDMPSISATFSSGLPSNEPIMAIETASIDLDIRILPWPTIHVARHFKLQLEVKDVFIAHLKEDVQKLLRETKIAK